MARRRKQSPTKPPSEPPLEPARIWLDQYAKWHVPVYNPPSQSRSSSDVPEKQLELVVSNPPTMAFYDEEKTQRLINSLESVLQDIPLQASVQGNGSRTPSMVRYLFAKLFYPLCTHDEGIGKDMWREISNKIVCNRLTHEALLHALKVVTERLFGKRIYTATEPLHPGAKPDRFDGTTAATLKKVDFAVFLEDEDIALFLVEGKTPPVLRSLGILFNGESIRINFQEESPTSGEKILFKLIFYMYLWKRKRLVITSFREAFILELHESESGMIFLSYSKKIELHENSELFRAMLGMILTELEIASYQPFDANTAFASYREGLLAEANERAESRSERGSGPPSDPCSGPPSGPSGGAGPSGGGRGSGSWNTTKTSGTRGTKCSHGETNGTLTDTNSADEIASSRVTRSMSKPLIKAEHEEAVRSMTSLMLGDESLHIIGPGIDLLLDRDSVSPFPKLSTSGRVPCLKVISTLECLNGLILEAVLQGSNDSDSVSEAVGSTFIVKVVDVSQLSYEKYRNSLEELVKEYKTYYLLAIAKRSGRYTNIIQKFTPTCYGLYFDRAQSTDLFALVIECVGDVDLAEYMSWSESDKVALMKSLLALHSIGLKHGDPDERNVGIDRNSVDPTYRFFDFGCSSWHKCHGITECRELKDQIRILYDLQEPPWDPLLIQERTTREHAFPFCNLEDVEDGMQLFETERTVLRLRALGAQYYQEFTHRQD
ncbi:hypothetical protein ACEPAG_3153 [Sanghuangporus baumii]